VKVEISTWRFCEIKIEFYFSFDGMKEEQKMEIFFVLGKVG